MNVELNPVKWSREERQEFLDKGFRGRREGEHPCTQFVRPSDYDNDMKRGTLEYMSEWNNYSLHNVSIPDNTVIYDANFTQCSPRTDAISGKNLTFVRCNLTNCLIDPSWKLEACNTAQAWLVEEMLNGYPVEKREYIGSNPEAAINAEPPANVILSREY